MSSFNYCRQERGEYFAIDLGGSNLRVMWVRLGSEAGSVAEEDIQEWPIPPEVYDTDNGKLMPWIADCTLRVMAKHGAAGEASNASTPPVVGFCFSFACEQTALDNGTLLLWTKSFRGKGLIGEDVVAALVAAFAARGVAVRVPCLLNDTVATLVALKYAEPATAAGIILGTGTNCAYLEPCEKIGRLREGYRPRGPAMVINTEWGDLRCDEHALPRCHEDIWVDCASANPGHGQFEKLIAGLYMGEVARRILLNIAEQTGLLGGYTRPGQGLAKEGSFGSAALAAIDEDASSNLSVTAETLKTAFGLGGLSGVERQLAKEVCGMVAGRSARLCAAAIAAVLDRVRHDASSVTPESPIVIAVDGSVFAKYGKYRERLHDALGELIGQRAAEGVKMRLVRDGSVAGAAFLAAAASGATQ